MTGWVILALFRVDIGMIKVLGNGGIFIWAFLILAGIVIYNLIPDSKQPPKK